MKVAYTARLLPINKYIKRYRTIFIFFNNQLAQQKETGRVVNQKTAHNKMQLKGKEIFIALKEVRGT